MPTPILEQLKRSPRLRLYVDELEATLRREQEARQRFYDELTEDSNAEFINGEVIVQSPAKLRHLETVLRIASALKVYVQVHQLGLVTSEHALISLTRNDYEPDVCFWLASKTIQFTSDQLHFPAPDLVVEVLSPTTEQIDRTTKFDDYAAHGVGEYWIVDADAQVLEQYVLGPTGYELRLKSTDGTVQSAILSSLAIPVRAMFDDAENTAFVRRVLP